LPVSRLSSWVLAVAALALGCAGTSPQNREPTTSWDQQAVTDLAAQLQTSTEALYNQVREAPATITPGMENAPEGMGGSARVMHEEAGALHAKLAAGKGREDTLNAYRRIKELSRDVGESSRLTDVAAEVGAAQGGMRSILSQLDAYYGTQ
jgi:hypothetical protein